MPYSVDDILQEFGTKKPKQDNTEAMGRISTEGVDDILASVNTEPEKPVVVKKAKVNFQHSAGEDSDARRREQLQSKYKRVASDNYRTATSKSVQKSEDNLPEQLTVELEEKPVEKRVSRLTRRRVANLVVKEPKVKQVAEPEEEPVELEAEHVAKDFVEDIPQEPVVIPEFKPVISVEESASEFVVEGVSESVTADTLEDGVVTLPPVEPVAKLEDTSDFGELDIDFSAIEKLDDTGDIGALDIDFSAIEKLDDTAELDKISIDFNNVSQVAGTTPAPITPEPKPVKESPKADKGKRRGKVDIIKESFSQQNISTAEDTNSFNFASLNALFEDDEKEPSVQPLEKSVVTGKAEGFGSIKSLMDAVEPIGSDDTLDQFEDFGEVNLEPEPEPEKKHSRVLKIHLGRGKRARAQEQVPQPAPQPEPQPAPVEETQAPDETPKSSKFGTPISDDTFHRFEEEQAQLMKALIEKYGLTRASFDTIMKGGKSSKTPTSTPTMKVKSVRTAEKQEQPVQKPEPQLERKTEPEQEQQNTLPKLSPEAQAVLRNLEGAQPREDATIVAGEKNLLSEDEPDVIDKFFTLTKKLGSTLARHARHSDVEREQLNAENEIEGQIVIEGFNTDEPSVQISESELREQLSKSRLSKIEEFSSSAFSVVGGDDALHIRKGVDESQEPVQETEEPLDESDFEEIVDYSSQADERAIFFELRDTARKYRNRGLLLGFLEFVLILVNILGSGVGSIAGVVSSFGLESASPLVYILINLVVLAVMIATDIQSLTSGLFALFKLKPNSDSVLSLACLFTVGQGIYTAFSVQSGGVVTHIYPCVAGLTLLLSTVGKASLHKRVYQNFRCLVANKSKAAVSSVTSQTEAYEMGRGIDIEDPYIRFTAPVDFATGFLKNSYYGDPADLFAGKVGPWLLLVSLVSGLLTGIITRTVLFGVSATTAALLISCVMGDVLAYNRPFTKLNRKLNVYKSFVSGFGAVDDISASDCVIVTSEDLFPSGTCNFRGIKLFNDMPIVSAITYITAVLKTTDSPLREVFSQVVEKGKEMLPPVEGTAYEERMGVSAWIYNHRILVGSKELLEGHGVEVPAKARPEDYTMGNQRVIFLAIDGKACAMFIVSYAANRQVRDSLQKLERAGVNVLVKTPDANLDEKFLSKIFGLGPNTVRVMSSIGGGIFDKLRNTTAPKLPATLVTDGKVRSFLNAVAGCVNVYSTVRVLNIIQLIAIALGILVVTVCGCCGALRALGPVSVCLYSAFWLIVQRVVSSVKKF